MKCKFLIEQNFHKKLEYNDINMIVSMNIIDHTIKCNDSDRRPLTFDDNKFSFWWCGLLAFDDNKLSFWWCGFWPTLLVPCVLYSILAMVTLDIKWKCNTKVQSCYLREFFFSKSESTLFLGISILPNFLFNLDWR